ncbi:imidazolonepropionase [Frondihabitans australicus]|uniref:Imidazolonepropionase n=1 Tax=Frondihabitans australicus TaxID=386892 RepID=A0A495IM37_9MICO|nr:imidazolonepropionase [Frondihabitans australicus]RKR76488.1 imidazolonepropionase [Frondihabitans australicus]
MTSTVLRNIGLLVTNDPAFGGPSGSAPGARLGEIREAALVVEDGLVAWVGPAAEAPAADRALDAEGRTVIPGFVDSHSHIVFGGDRSAEYEARMSGGTYAAGGIRSTVAATRAATDDELLGRARSLIAEMRSQGTTTVEIKSGYGLTVDDEARLVRLAAQLTDEVTFLGAHVVPAGADADEYVSLVTGPMLDAVAEHAKWIDVFCERGAFDVEQTRRILQAGISRGLLPRLHAAQLQPGEGVALGVSLGAASIDHCTFLTDDDVALLAGSSTFATLLPGVEFSTRQPYPSGRRLIDAGAAVAIATDCNPGSCFTSSMPFCIALAIREMGMTPAEALWSATRGGARALRRDDIGWLRIGARADVVELDAPSYVHLGYRPGVPLVHTVRTAADW